MTATMGHPLDGTRCGDDLLLRFDAEGLGLHALDEPGAAPLRVDFSAAAIQSRARDALAGQHLSRAVGGGVDVLDATAGLGRDAFLLASIGKRVLLLERDPIVHALFADGLRRGLADPELAPVIARMELRRMDFRDYDEPRRFDVVCLDPMFPRPGSRARGKKEMVFLQRLLAPRRAGEQTECGFAGESGLLAKARGLARARVVVKRPPREGWIEAVKPAFSYRGRTSRYDVYLPL